MTVVLERAGAAFLRAFGAAILVYATGVLAAPDLNAALTLGAAALAASFAAGLRAIQVFVPAISTKGVLGDTPGAWVDSFLRAFLAVLITAATGWLAAPDLTTWKAVATGAIVGAVAAGIRALQGLLTAGEQPAP